MSGTSVQWYRWKVVLLFSGTVDLQFFLTAVLLFSGTVISRFSCKVVLLCSGSLGQFYSCSRLHRLPSLPANSKTTTIELVFFQKRPRSISTVHFLPPTSRSRLMIYSKTRWLTTVPFHFLSAISGRGCKAEAFAVILHMYHNRCHWQWKIQQGRGWDDVHRSMCTRAGGGRIFWDKPANHCVPGYIFQENTMTVMLEWCLKKSICTIYATTGAEL